MRFRLTLNIGGPIIGAMNIQFTISALRGAGLTQTQIGDELDLSQSTISDMEAGKCGVTRPSHKLVTGLCSLAIKYRVKTEPPAPKPPRTRTSRKPPEPEPPNVPP